MTSPSTSIAAVSTSAFAARTACRCGTAEKLALIMPVTFLLIMILLYGLFNSWRDSVLALLGLPFAISGGLVGLYFFDLWQRGFVPSRV